MSGHRSVAIVGIGGVFPEAPDPQTLWRNILSRTSAAREVPSGRWELSPEDAYDPHPAMPDKVSSKRACFVDPSSFSIDTTQLNLSTELLDELDPLFHLLLYAGQQAFEDAGADGWDRRRIGAIVGNLVLPTDASAALAHETLGRTFEEIVRPDRPLQVHQTHPLNRYVAGLPAGILSKALELGGGCHTLDAACASSLYALKLAIDELTSHRADAMLAGGVSRPSSLYTQMGFSQLTAVSPSGTPSPFDVDGDGLVVGEGAGVFVLKRTEDAVRDGDHIYGVIRGIGLSNDVGGRLLAPTSEGQLRAMRAAYRQAGWNPTDVDLVECHATGIPMGDSVEIESLKALWLCEDGTNKQSAYPWKPGQCVIGSVKSNVGHLLTAAASAALTKVLFALKEETLPPAANFTRAHEGLGLDESPFRVLKAGEVWAKRDDATPRRAAISAFGFGGINAHALVEEWQVPGSKQIAVEVVPATAADVAIVGLDAHFGHWKGLKAFQERVLGGRSDEDYSEAGRCWGVERSAWFSEEGPSDQTLSGRRINSLYVPLDRFRIPPKELKEMLPQQLLMLEVASGAWHDAQLDDESDNSAGVFIGLGFDLNATNFHLRWTMPNNVRRWSHDLCSDELADWTFALREAAGPPLTANRTMGALGSVVASRIARELRLGGPSFTISSEETSGIHALRVAVQALTDGDIDVALAGAVDLAGDIRAVLSSHVSRPFSASGTARPFDVSADGTSLGEGAAALVLKRLEDALADGDRVYGVIKGIGSASGGAAEAPCPDAETSMKAMERAYSQARIDPATIGYIVTNGSGCPTEDAAEAEALAAFFRFDDGQTCALGSAKSDVGHAGAASGLASVVKACLSLYQEIIPPLRGFENPRSEFLVGDCSFFMPSSPRFWLHDSGNGPRRAAAHTFSIDGNCAHVVLEGLESEHQSKRILPATAASIEHSKRRPLGAPNEALFVVSGDTHPQLIDGLTELAEFAGIDSHSSHDAVGNLARRWWRRRGADVGHDLAVALIARNTTELIEQANFARESISRSPNDRISGADPKPFARDRVFYSAKPFGRSTDPSGQLAFVFPGSGNQYADMGRDLFVRWPETLRQQQAENLRLAGQFRPDRFWNHDAWTEETLNETLADHNAMILGQVALGTAVSQLMQSFGVSPDAVIGYSLGETAGLFSLRAWTNRDEMLQRIESSTLFTDELAGDFNAARRTWNLPPNEIVDWVLGVIDRPISVLKRALKDRKRAYALIANTPHESVVGGARGVVKDLVNELKCEFIPVKGVTAAHCEIVKAVERPYRDLHVFEVTPPEGVEFYSGAWARPYQVTSDSAADAILAHALHGVDYCKTIEAAYKRGVRIFLELGPGASCSRMISRILDDRPHVARSVCMSDRDATSLILRGLGQLVAERVEVDLDSLYSDHEPLESCDQTNASPTLSVPIGGDPFCVPKPPAPAQTTSAESVPNKVASAKLPDLPTVDPTSVASDTMALVNQIAQTEMARADAHEAFLKASAEIEKAMLEAVAIQKSMLGVPGADLSDSSLRMTEVQSTASSVFLTREQCMEFAVGRVGNVFGPEFAEVDTYPTRVRLPDDPLMLVHRVIAIEGEPKSLGSGRIVTEHDVAPDVWHLDGGSAPTCIAVEAGQADLMLSGYLGIDFKGRGLAVYRLLDADITFHRHLPVPGETIRYDIRIEEFFVHNGTWFFRFQYDGMVAGQPLMTMRNGCAGFFTEEELAAGRGIVETKLDTAPTAGKRPDDWEDLVSMAVEAYDEEQLDALRSGDLAACFGPQFDGLTLGPNQRLPGGDMTLVHRVIELDPSGGRFGLGCIRAEADIRPDDWFLTCHFVDDKVMPGTLMFECCMHTMRVFLLRMGWITEDESGAYEPISGVKSRLKCRGQVLDTTAVVTYEVAIKELGYGPEPYAIADAKMFADGRHIVGIEDMSIRFTGLSREQLTALWSSRESGSVEPKPAIYDRDSILAFAVGKPSEAFGDRYEVFDNDRVIARLPGPPYAFIDRITRVQGEPWNMIPGGVAEAQYEIPPDAWYFGANRQADMPFAVLLEVALQPCGWLAAYVGSALTSDTDLSFRNLGGDAVQYLRVLLDTGLLTTTAKLTSVSNSAGMIIQNYDMEIQCSTGTVYRGKTSFGFFSKEALAQQVGVQGAQRYQPSSDEIERGRSSDYPISAPFPEQQLRMIESIELFVSDGGPNGLGFIRGIKKVDPDEWFFKAHFHQDPVMPGSLGLEAFNQLLKVAACDRWGTATDTEMTTVAVGEGHTWAYRGQVVPSNGKVTVEATVTSIDDKRRMIRADGFLVVDGKVIYKMTDFTLEMRVVGR
ncbi:MAG: acyltransferase domain-containing protein [bacterium]|nr:acyltransferase domain-containing protein [bacterium]